MINEALANQGLEAVDRFIQSFNSRSAEAFAAALHYPHVRPSHFGRSVVIPDAQTYIANHSYQGAIDMGWDHSEWDYTHPIHTSEEKIHVAGQWTRYTAEGVKIISTPIVYIVTRLQGAWGIQSRFAADFSGDDDVTAVQQRSFKLIESFIQGFNRGNRESCAELLNYPHFEVSPGAVRETASAAQFALMSLSNLQLDSMVGLQTGHHTTNLALDLSATDREGGARRFECVALVTEREEHLGIQAWSLIAA
jgi:hypothetical protein